MNKTESPSPTEASIASIQAEPSNALSPAHERAETVAEIARFLHARGWTPATSSNFSFRESADAASFRISVSGLDKGTLTAGDFLRVDASGQSGVDDCGMDAVLSAKRAASRKPSAETLLHGLIYRLFPAANVVLHTHSVNGTVLSKLFERKDGLWLEDFEILKGLEGVRTHETRLWLPVFPNSQEMSALAETIEETLRKSMPLAASFPGAGGLYQPGSVPGFLLAGHGLYAWGETPEQASRHVEVFEFLFECLLKLRLYGHAAYSG